MAQRVVVITGASDGVGAAAARTLADQGNRVVVVGRNPQRTVAVANEIGAQHFLVDFAQLDDVRRLAVDLHNNVERIDVLANNAGGIMGARQVTDDGFEMTFQVNHLASFLLTNLLLDKLRDAKASVVNTASVGHRAARLYPDDFQLEIGWTLFRAYANSKLMNILFTRELHRRYSLQGLSSACFHPGIVSSGFAKGPSGWMGKYYGSWLGKHTTVSPEKGARTLEFLAQGLPPRDWTSGGYYYNSRRIRPSRAARDQRLAMQLWKTSAQLVELPGD